MNGRAIPAPRPVRNLADLIGDPPACVPPCAEKGHPATAEPESTTCGSCRESDVLFAFATELSRQAVAR